MCPFPPLIPSGVLEPIGTNFQCATMYNKLWLEPSDVSAGKVTSLTIWPTQWEERISFYKMHTSVCVCNKAKALRLAASIRHDERTHTKEINKHCRPRLCFFISGKPVTKHLPAYHAWERGIAWQRECWAEEADWRMGWRTPEWTERSWYQDYPLVSFI